MKKVDLEEILKEFETFVTLCQPHNQTPIFLKENVLIAMRNACEQTVELCAENSTTECTNLGIRVDKQSILNIKNQIV